MRNPLLLSLALAVLPLCTPLAAQPSATAIAKNPLIYAGWAGCEELRPDLEKTGWGALRKEPACQRFEVALRAGWNRFLQKISAEGEVPVPVVNIAGNLVDIVCKSPSAFAVNSVAMGAQGPELDLIWIVHAGERSEILVDCFRTLFEQEANEVSTISVSGQEFTEMRLDDAPLPVVFGSVNGAFLLAPGAMPIERALARMKGNDNFAHNVAFAASQKKLGGGKLAFAAQVNIPELIQTFETTAAQTGQTLPPKWATAKSELGLERLKPLAYQVNIVGGGFRHGLLLPVEGGFTPAQPVTDDDLRWIPGDTLFASVFTIDMGWCYRTARQLIEATGEQVLIQNVDNAISSIEATLGFRIAEDFLDTLGSRFVLYEESSLRSWISLGITLVMKPKDIQRMRQSLSRVLAMGAGLSARAGNVAVEVRSFESHGTPIEFLHTGGVPNPLAPAWCQRDDSIIISLFPAGVERALSRTRAEDGGHSSSVLASADFRRARQQLPANAGSLEYHNVPETVRLHYPLLLPVLHAVAAAGSLAGFDTDASMIPAPDLLRKHWFGELAGSVVDQDGFMAVHHGPLPVSIPVLGSIPMAAFASGLLVPTIFGARERSDALIRSNSLKQLSISSMVYADEHRSHFPPDLQALIEFTPELEGVLRPWNDIAPPVYLGRGLLSTSRGQLVLMYDPNMRKEGMLIAFVDGSVEWIPEEQARALIEATEESKQ